MNLAVEQRNIEEQMELAAAHAQSFRPSPSLDPYADLALPAASEVQFELASFPSRDVVATLGLTAEEEQDATTEGVRSIPTVVNGASGSGPVLSGSIVGDALGDLTQWNIQGSTPRLDPEEAAALAATTRSGPLPNLSAALQASHLPSPGELAFNPEGAYVPLADQLAIRHGAESVASLAARALEEVKNLRLRGADHQDRSIEDEDSSAKFEYSSAA